MPERSRTARARRRRSSSAGAPCDDADRRPRCAQARSRQKRPGRRESRSNKSNIYASVATKPAASAVEHERPPAAVGDIRQGKPYVLARAPLRLFAFRLASVCSLVVLDVCAISLSLYVALALREVYYGKTPILWGLLWDAESEWLPFVTLITVLVFWQAGMYASL